MYKNDKEEAKAKEKKKNTVTGASACLLREIIKR